MTLIRCLPILLLFASSLALANKAPTTLAPGTFGSASSVDQEPIAVPLELRSEEVEEFLAPLSDQQTRLLLIEHLKRTTRQAEIEDASSEGGGVAEFLQGIQQRAIEIGEATEAHRSALGDIGASLNFALLLLTDQGGAPVLWKGLGNFLIMVLCGAILVFAFTRATREMASKLTLDEDAGIGLQVLALTLRLLLDLVRVALFTACAYGVSFYLYDRFDPMRYLMITYLTVIASVWVTWIASRFLFSPNDESLRLIKMPDADARDTHHWIVGLMAMSSLAFFTCGLLAITGLKAELLRLYVISSGGVVILLLLIWIWMRRARVTGELTQRIVPGCTGERLRHSLADGWHWFTSVYLIGLWWIWASNVLLQWDQQARAAIYSLLVLIVLPFADYFFGALMQLLLRNDARDAEAQARMRDFVLTLQRSLRWVLIVVAVIVLSGAWSTNLYSMVQTETGSVVFDAVLNIAVTLLLAFIAWEAVKIFIDPHIPEKPAEGVLDLEGDGGGVGGTRSETLMPLFRTFICIVLVVTVVMIVLSSLGVDIAPLLAGAGVIGLAVGFGAQKLVQDIISGIFFLIDDAFRIGEYVQAGELRGTVERITLRSMKLRHHLGMVQTIPFGDISAITNHSRDWIIMKLEFRMPYDTDIEKVRKLIKKLGQEMQQHPDYGQYMLQPLKSQGVLRIEESTLIMRMKFTAVPGQQWIIRREAYRRVQELFKENGLEFAHRKVLVESTSGLPLSDEELERAGAVIAEQDDKTAAPRPKDEQ
ncbi:MAG: mechanosensitive ion channel domain-containing protein [Pseudomonadota bacterium]